MSLSKGNSHKFISLFVAGNTRGLRVENRGSNEVRKGLLKDGPEGRQDAWTVLARENCTVYCKDVFQIVLS